MACAIPDKSIADAETLLQLFPDADPEFILLMYEKIKYDEDQIKMFIIEAIEKRDYPKKKDKMKMVIKEALHVKYVENFKVEDFLEEIPDPLTFFSQKNHQPNKSDELYAKWYLENRYKVIDLRVILYYYRRHGYNLRATCQYLDQWTGNLEERKNFTFSRPLDVSVQLLQEVAFIENEWKIRAFLKEKQQRKQEAFKKATVNGEFLECQCCCDNEVLAEDVETCLAGHIFCKTCIIKSAEIIIGQGGTTFPCLVECDAEFSFRVLEKIMRRPVFTKLVQRKQIEELQAAGIEGLESCPVCNFVDILPKDERVFHCQNINCMLDSCRMCKKPNHIPLRCKEVESNKQVKMRTYIENKMAEALIRTCWSCKRRFIKEFGCNKMVCCCGAQMCYICRQPVTSYSHFNGEGGTEYHKCPLFSELKDLHEKAVRKEGLKAKKKVLNENPRTHLPNDPTELATIKTKKRK